MSDQKLPLLIETDWLSEHLHDSNLRILDCTPGNAAGRKDVTANGGLVGWRQGHIPGSGWFDLLQALSDNGKPIPTMMPPVEQFAAFMSQAGVDQSCRVVLYDSCHDQWAHVWAAMTWWMLKSFGFEAAGVLNGGLYKWKKEDRALSTAACGYQPAQFKANWQAGLVASKEEVESVLGKPQNGLVCALPPEELTGAGVRYARPGHIPGSIFVPTVNLIDPDTHAYLPLEQLRSQFAAKGVLERERIITYCGGGAAASSDTLALTLLGASDIAVYGGGLYEWAADPNAPLENEQ